MAKVPYRFYQKNMKVLYGLFGLILAISGTIGYFIKSYYGFPDIQSMEVVFFSSLILYYVAVQVFFRKKIREFNDTENKKAL
jgi:hypothetical protein